jgi:hypothetical protein
MIKSFFQKVEKYGVIILVIVALIAGASLIFNFWNPIKGLFGSGKQETIRVEDTPEYKKLEQDNKLLADSVVSQEITKAGLKAEIKMLQEEGGQIQPRYIEKVKEQKSKTPAQVDQEYQKNLKQQDAELEVELK